MGSYRNTYEILIASPSDLSEERSKIVKAICQWNFENRDKGIAFSPLLWEWNAVSDFDKAPQESINEQILNRADFVIAAFKSRLGTPTQDYPAGTIEELSKRKGAAAVFFPKIWPDPIPVPNDPGYVELRRQIDQIEELKKFYGEISGRFSLQYDNPDDLLNKVKQTLKDWAEREKVLPLLCLVPGPYDPKKLLLQAVPPPEKAHVLLFNSELWALKTREEFEKRWSFLLDMPWVEKVILLIPRPKIDRLKYYLSKSTGDADPELLKRFFVSPQTEPAKPGPWSFCSGLAFALLRYGTDPTQGIFAPLTQFAVLADPFSSQHGSPSGGNDVEWGYKYYFEFSEHQLQEKFGEIWDQWFHTENLTEVSKLVAISGINRNQ